MRLALVASLSASLAALSYAEDAAVPVASSIGRVTVYEDRALVTRVAKASVAQGVTRLAFERLPPGLDPASVRARCGAARVLGVDLETVHLAKETREDLARAVASHNAAKRELAGAEMELAEAKDRWELLRSMRAKGVEGAERALGGAGGTDTGSLKRILELVGEEGAAARRAVLTATEAVETARGREEAARRRLAELETGSDRTETRVLVTLEADAAAADAPVTVQYMVGGASWRPVYDLRVDEEFASASLGLGAVVVQRTGEEWKGVALELTTAQPSAGASPPEPEPWRIWVPRADAGPGVFTEKRRGAPGAKPAAAPAEDAAELALKLEDKDAGFAPILRRSGLVVAFESRLAETIASDGNPSRVALARFDMKPDVRWNAFPRATDKVFVTAKMANTTGTPLPAGETRVFVGSDYVGPMQLKDWAVEKEIDVGLGVDREVETERERLSGERTTEGVFSKDTVHTSGWRLAVKNHRSRAISVRLLDQVPVSNDEELTVKLLTASLALAQLPDRDAETNKARGVLEWRFELGAREDRDVRFSYEVRHPRSLSVGGLGGE